MKAILPHCLCFRKLQKSNWVAEEWLKSWSCFPTQVLLSANFDLCWSKLNRHILSVCMSIPGYSMCLFQTGNKRHSCLCTYPVHLHILKLQAKVITLYEVASVENLRQEGLSKSFWLEEKTTEKKELFSWLYQTKDHTTAVMIHLTVSMVWEMALFWEKSLKINISDKQHTIGD